MHAAITKVWDLDEAGRVELACLLRELLGSGELSPRETARVHRILLALDVARLPAPDRAGGGAAGVITG